MKYVQGGGKRSLFVYTFILLASSINAFGQLPPSHAPLPNYDKRSATTVPPRAEAGPAVATLQQQVPGVNVDFDRVTGSASWVHINDQYLSGPGGVGAAISDAALAAIPLAEPNRATRAFLNEHAALFGHGADVLDSARVKRDFVTAHNGVHTVVWEQQLDGISVFEALLISHTTEAGELVSVATHFQANLAGAADAGSPRRAQLQNSPDIPASQAIVLAAREVNETLTDADISPVDPDPAGAEKRQSFQASALNGDTVVRLVWLPMSDAATRLCWEVILTSHARGEMFRVLIDAESGEALVRQCLTDYISNITLRVYTSDSPSPFSPGNPTPTTNQPPLVARSLLTLSALNTNASPNGWINDGINETRGNNVDAHTDRDDNDVADTPRPQGSPARVFDFPLDLNQSPLTYSNAAVVQLFYWNNFMHDKLYELGFTEAAGNFQNDNFGRGGLGNDAVQADGQDGGGFNNANFSTPPDGSPGRMQMYLFDGPNPDRDGDLDAEVILHEYAHGLSNRRVGGGVGISALQSGGMGEGWSDFYGLALLSEPGDDLNGAYAAGGYLTYQLSGLLQNYYYGIRRYPYCTDTNKNPLTFKDLDPAQASAHAGIPRNPIIGNTANEVHNMGEVWCVTLWDARANLINKYGYAVGNHLILQLVTDGMNLSPANPNFLQARDAIIQADVLNSGGANRTELWVAFAKRGMGVSATSPASTTTAGVHEAFDLPFPVPALIVPTNVTEGDGVLVGQGAVRIPAPVATNLTFNLVSSDTSEVTVPAAVTVLAGQTNVAFDVTIVDDAVLDGTQDATVTASAPGYATVFRIVRVADNETATLTVSVPANTTEGAGTVPATVSVSAVPAANIVVNLTSSDTSEILVPATVTIPAGQLSVGFNLAVVDDQQIDGDQSATIAAHVNNWTDGSANITVHDNENNSLTVVLPPQAREGDGVRVNGGSVRLTGTLPTNVVVSLSSDDTSELIVPASITILAGQTNATFNLTIVDDPIVDGTQTPHVTATAPGFLAGSAPLPVTDDESPFAPSNPKPPHLAVDVLANTSLAWNNGASTELIVNGGFETGTLGSWVQVPSAFGQFVINNGTLDLPSPDGPLPPFSGSYSALGSETGPGAFYMYQDVAIPANISFATLSWAHRVRNFYSQFSDLQQFRVEIRNTNNVVQAVAFSTSPGDPLLGDWVQKNYDLSAFIGQKVRVTFYVNPGGFFLDAHVDNVSLQVSSSSSGVTNDVYFGTNPTPGPAEFLGSTTNSSWTLPLLAPQTTYYWQVVARKVGVTPGPVWRFTTRGLDHFTWDTVPSPQLVNQPFLNRITAKDSFEQTVTSFNGSVALSASSGGSVPALNANFESGLHGFTTNNSFGSGNGLWHLSTGRATNPGHSPTHSLYYGRNEGPAGGGTFDTGTANGGIVTSSPIAIPPAAAGLSVLSFSYLMNVEALTSYDVAFVEVSANNGATYTALASKGAGLNANTGGLWVSNSISLAPYAGSNILLRFRFDTLDAIANSTEGWYIDDIVIRTGPNGIPVSITPTTSGPFVGGVWTGAITVLQNGTNVTLRADDGVGHLGVSNPFEVSISNDVSVAIVDTPDPVPVGGMLTYTLKVANTGPTDATGVLVSNTLPASVNFVSAISSQGTCNRSGTLVTADLGTIPGGTNATITIVVVPTAAGAITNSARVTRAEPDSIPANNLASAVTTVTPPSITIDDLSVSEGNSGFSTAVFTLRLSAASGQSVSVSYVTAALTATPGSDYLTTSGVVTFVPGQTNRPLNVTIIGDGVYETNESFLVNLSSPINAVIGDSQAVGTIMNDDPLPTVSITGTSIVEKNMGTTNAIFNVQLSNPSSLTVTVNFRTLDGTATAGFDYATNSGTVTFTPGSLTRTIPVAVNGDIAVEPDETFLVQLSNPGNAALGASQATGTIVNDDGVHGAVDHFIWYPIASPEAQGKPCNVTVVAIDSFGSYAKFFSGTANLTASRGAAAVPMNPTTPVQFTNGFWSGDITILQSSTNVVLRADDGDGHTGSSNPFDVMLLDDISITMTDSPDPVSTGASLTYTLVVTNIGPAPATNVVVSNTLPNAVAFVSANSTQGTCTQTGSVVTCAIGTLPGGAGATVTIFVTAGVATSSTITNTAAVYRGEPDPVLTNNVATAVTTLFTPLLSVNDVIVVEGNSGTTNAVLSFTLSPPGIVPVSVQFSTANGTAAAGSDYVPTNGTLNFAPGQTLKTVTVVVNGDTASEPSEYLFLNLTSPANALLARTQAVVTIVNDEAAPVAYMRSSVGAPWGSVANETAMNRVFGANNWQDLRYETVIPANVFSPATKFIYMEGSDNNAVELETFLGSNIVTIQNWVSNGGNLFLNAAPNEDNGMSFGFGVTLIYSDFSSTGTASLPSHPIFIGPFTPVGTSWNGNYFGHATVTGTGLLALITSSGNGHIVLGEKSWGNGRVLFGGMTTDNFHSPQPQAPNLRANILAYLSSLAASLDAPPVIQNLTVQGTTMSFSWTSRPGQRYQIYCADDLMGSPWLPLGEEVVATDTTTTFADPNPPSTQRFYRIMEVR